MDILFVDFYSLRSGYGGELWIRDVSMNLSERHRVKVITSSLKVDGKRSLAPRKESFRLNMDLGFDDELRNNGIDVVEFDNIPYTTFPNFTGLKTLYNMIRWADVVYFHYMYGGIEVTVKFLSEILGVPVICGHHSPLYWYKKEEDIRAAEKIYFKIFGPAGKRIGELFPFHQVLNTSDLDEIRRWNVNKIFYIPVGHTKVRPEIRSKYEKFTVLFLGRFDRHKGADQILPLVELISNKGLRLEFHIAGRGGPFEDDLRALGERFEFVKFLGYISDEEKIKEVSKAHVLIMLSRYEGFPKVALESIFAGTPVIGFPIEGLSDLIVNGQNGFIVTDLEDALAKISYLMDECKKGRFSIIVDSTLSSSSKYEWGSIYPRIESMFLEVKGTSR